MWDIHLYVVALRGFSLGNPAFPRGCEQGHLYKPATRPARRIGQGKTFPRPIFSRASSARANSPNWACKQVCASRASRCFVGKKSPLHLLEITIYIFFLFLKALDEQEVALKQQIVHLEKQVKESTPDKAKLKQLQDAVKKHEKGKKY